MSLIVLITSPTLGVRRCAADEPNAAWVPEGIWWNSAMPGGWKEGGFNLRQRIDQDLGLRLLDIVEIKDEDGKTVYRGRITKLPRQHGDDYLLGVECMGMASTMLDDPSVPFFYVDPDMTGWQEATLVRRAALAEAGDPQGRIPVQMTQGGIVWDIPAEALAAGESAEILYIAPAGQTIGLVAHKGARAGTWTDLESPEFWYDDNEAFSGAGAATLALDNAVHTTTIPDPGRYAMLRARVTTGHTPAGGVQQRYTKLAVHGNHGLDPADIEDELPGYWIDDMLVHALTLACPKLVARKVEDGGLVERPPLVVAQAADRELGTIDRIVLELNKYVLYEWGVYERDEFFYRATDPDRLCWEARLDEGIHLGLEGDDAEHALNGMLVKYTLADGTPRVAGPVGSGMDVESELLGDTDPENTATQHGYPRRWGEQTISTPVALDMYAVALGAAYLYQASLPARKGDITLVGKVKHPTKGMRPVREMRAMDWVRLSDHPADVPRRIISTNARDEGLSNTVSVGNDMDRVDAMLEQFGVKTRIAVG